jgi:hypothetical protein
MSAISAVSPIAELAGLFLDKPQMPDEAARMYIAPGTNFMASDVRDQGYSMSLYKTAYMGTNSETLPESSDVSWLAIAMRPALQFTDFLTNTLNIRDHPSHPITTPFGWAISSHMYWRGSIRYRINFYASTFVSGRILIVYSPPSAAAVTTINNTISKLVSVKGDTTVEFTLPFVSPTDFQPLNYPQVSGSFYGTGVLTFSVYGVITSSDAATDATIDLVAWTAAAPDAQFMQPLISTQYSLTPAAFDARKQADICEAFTKTFPPYVDGCEYLTDSGYVASELSRSPMDVLKRYQVYGTGVDVNSPLPGVYTPLSGTLGFQIKSAFAFMRGGVNYKTFPNYNENSDYVDPANLAKVTWSVSTSWPFYSPGANYSSGFGLPFLYVGQSDSEVDISVPYTNQYPFIFTMSQINPSSVPAVAYVTPRDNPTSYTAGPPPVANRLVWMDIYTCVRDDFMMGWLLAPVPYRPTALPKAAPKEPLSQLEPDEQPLASTQPQPKQLTMLDFLL